MKLWGLGLGAVALALCWPLHLFPMPNFIEELFVGLAVLALLAGLFWSAPGICLSPWLLLWLGYGLLLALNGAWHAAAFVSGEVGYLVFWLSGLAALLIGGQVDWASDKPGLLLARILAGLAVVSAVGGVLRHYNLLWSGLGWLVPDVPSNRMIGLVGHANFFAYVSLMGIFALAWLFERRRIGFAWLLLLGLLLLYCIAASGGRSVLVAWAAVLAVALWSGRATAAWRFIAVIAAGLFAYLLLRPVMGVVDELLSAYFGGARLDQSLFDMAGRGLDSSGRLLEWRVAWQLFLDHWLMGVGAGNYAGAAFVKHVELGIASPPGLFLHSHNSVVQLLVEFGLLGGLWLLVMVAMAVLGLWHASRQRERILAVSILLAFAIYGLFEFPLWMMPFFILNLLLLGVLGGRGWELKFRLGRPVGVVVGLLTLVLALIYVPYVERFYWSFKQYLVREKVEAVEYQFINAMSADPLLEPYAYFIYLANFELSPATLDFERGVLERLQAYRPNHQVLIRLAIVYALQGDSERAQKVIHDMRLYYGGLYDQQLKDETAAIAKGFPGKDLSQLLK
ncbi:conserved membrane hypothetical protein [Pseudomonas sp. 8AS]|uniref:PglL family O-oligosaccharyltransferase n=1 Tax=Pseudomonas sp. 8AS TaxID=2653163 RepID=UPI0012F432B7|nr:Wzy polymerase domain-containing protein [Pseudomonas sp. 8AS]VXB29132.1 conserved membrane hypothetical protein [Pseudomonas sp. 8AS]